MLKYNIVHNGNSRNILICLHGFGSSYTDLKPLPFNLPNTAIVYVNAPIALPDMHNGFAWFNLFYNDNNVLDFNLQDIKHANTLLTNFVNYIATTYNVAHSNISLFGFSQGGMLALYNAMYSQHNYKAVVSHSGFFVLNGNIVNKNQNIMLLHGMQDAIVPFFLAQQTVDILNNNNIKHTTYFNNFEHTITAESLLKANSFLQ